MAGYIIGFVIGVIVFLLQNFKPTSVGFRVLYFLVSIAFLWGIFYAHLGYWNILIIPLGEIVLCLILAFCFPYAGKSAKMEYEAINGIDYFKKLQNKDNIGKIHPAGLKQTYDRIMVGLLTQIVTNQEELYELGNLIYSKNFYPISIHTKEEVLNHLNDCIEKVSSSSRYGKELRINAHSIIDQLFNTYVSVMSIHEEATEVIEEFGRHTD